MELRAGFKKTEVGIIPEPWQLKSFNELFNISGGLSASRDQLSSNGYCYLHYGDIHLSKKTYINVHQEYPNLPKLQISINKIPIGSILEDGDVVFVDASEDIEGTSRHVVIVNTKNILYISGLHTIVAKCKSNGLDHLFRRFCFQSPIIKNQFRFYAVGTKVSGISKTNIGKIILPIPPLAEQEAIAGALSDADAYIEGLEQLIAKKRLVKQGVMQELLTGRRRLPGFTGEWERKSIDDLFNISGGYSASRDQLSSDGHCYLHYGDIHLSTKTYIDVTAEYKNIPKLKIDLGNIQPRSLLEDGDVVFVDASEDDEGTSKHMVVINKDHIPYISGLHTIVLKGRTDELDHKYRQYCFQTYPVKKQFRFYAVGTKVLGISKTNIAKVIIPIPPRKEQVAISEALYDIDSEISALDVKLAKARLVKQGMMQELLTGRIRLV